MASHSSQWPPWRAPADQVIVRSTGERFLEIMGRAPATPATGITFENVSIIGSDFNERRNVFLVFPEGADRLLDWVRFQ